MIKRKNHTYLTLFVFSILLVGACLVAGCDDTKTEQTGLSVQTTTSQSNAGTHAGIVKAVDYHQLIAFLPVAPAGWTAKEPVGRNIGINCSDAWNTYYNERNPQITIVVTIIDTNYEGEQWIEWDSYEASKSEYGYVKFGSLQGFPYWEIYSQITNSYYGSVSVNKRFLVEVLSYENGRVIYDQLLNSIDYKGISDLQ